MAGRKRNHDSGDDALSRALRLTTQAMDLLDAHGSDPEGAAYLALAQQQMRKTLSIRGSQAPEG